MAETTPKQKAKAFDPKKSYKYGRIVDRGPKIRLSWQQKPKPIIVDGAKLINMGCVTAQDFWNRNPFNYPHGTIFTLAVIDPANQEEDIFSQGSHLVDSRSANLGDQAPIQLSSESDKMSAEVRRMYDVRIEEHKAEVDRLRTENTELRTQLETERSAANTKANAHREEVYKLERQLREIKLDQKYLEEKVLPRYKDKLVEATQLGDQIGNLKGDVVKQFFDTVAEHGIVNIFKGTKNVAKNLMGKKTSSADADDDGSSLTGADLGIPEVDD